jgi:hypothetical protein
MNVSYPEVLASAADPLGALNLDFRMATYSKASHRKLLNLLESKNMTLT